MPFLDRPSPVDHLARPRRRRHPHRRPRWPAARPYWLASAAITGRTVGVASTGNVLTFTSAGTATAPVTGAIATAQSYSDQLGFTGRLAFDPFHGDDWRVNLGAHASYVDRPANISGPSATGLTPITAEVVGLSNTQELRVDGTKLINTGNIDANHASDGRPGIRRPEAEPVPAGGI